MAVTQGNAKSAPIDLSNPKFFADVATLLADTDTVYYSVAGDVPAFLAGSPIVAPNLILSTKTEGYTYRVAAANATDHHIATAGGVKLYVLPNVDGNLDIKAFGAIVNNIAVNNSPIIGVGIDAAVALGKTLLLSGGDYHMSSVVRRNLAGGNPLQGDLSIEFAPGARIISTSAVFDLEGQRTERTVASPIAHDARTITLADASGIVAGDTIFLESIYFGEYSWRFPARETHLVKSVAGNVVTIHSPIRFNYTVEEVALCVTRKNYKLTIKNYDVLTNNTVPIQEFIALGMQVLVDGLTAKTNTVQSASVFSFAFIVRESVGMRITNARLEGHYYGINLDFCSDGITDGLSAVNMLQPYLCNSWSSNMELRNAIATSSGSVLDSHPTFNARFVNCHAYDCDFLGSPRGLGTIITDCSLQAETRPVRQHFFGPPTQNVPGVSGMNITQFPQLANFDLTISNVHLRGDASNTTFPGIFIAGNHRKININNVTAPSIAIEATNSTPDVIISNANIGILWTRFLGSLSTVNVVIDKLLSQPVTAWTYALTSTFVLNVSHTALQIKNFDPAIHYLYNVLTTTSKYRFSNCDISGVLDWVNFNSLPRLLVNNSHIEIANNARGISTSTFFNCLGNFGMSQFGPQPTVTELPVITGLAFVTETLTCSTGTTLTLSTFTRQWKRGAANIGTNSADYTLVEADYEQSITCVVTATNMDGSTDVTSNAVTVDAYAPEFIGQPEIVGSAITGDIITVSTVGFVDLKGLTGTFAYQWRRGVANIGTDSITYTLVALDEGEQITCDVTLTTAKASSTETTNIVVSIPPPPNLLTNPEFADAASGTPGTPPTSWANSHSTGELSVAGAVLTFISATGTERRGITQNIAATVGTYEFECTATANSGTCRVSDVCYINQTLAGTEYRFFSDGVLVPSTAIFTGTKRLRVEAVVVIDGDLPCRVGAGLVGFIEAKSVSITDPYMRKVL